MTSVFPRLVFLILLMAGVAPWARPSLGVCLAEGHESHVIVMGSAHDGAGHEHHDHHSEGLPCDHEDDCSDGDCCQDLELPDDGILCRQDDVLPSIFGLLRVRTDVLDLAPRAFPVQALSRPPDDDALLETVRLLI